MKRSSAAWWWLLLLGLSIGGMASLKSAEAVEPLARCAAELVFGAPAETKPMPRRRQGAPKKALQGGCRER